MRSARLVSSESTRVDSEDTVRRCINQQVPERQTEQLSDSRLERTSEDKVSNRVSRSFNNVST